MPGFSSKSWRHVITELRDELQGKRPFGTTFSDEQSQIIALAEEVRDLHKIVAGLQAELAAR